MKSNDNLNPAADLGSPEIQRVALRRKQGEAIGAQLRAQFESVVSEPVPSDLIALLDELERREIEG